MEDDVYESDYRNPYRKICYLLNEYPELVKHIPKKWEYIGNIVIVRMDPVCYRSRYIVGRAISEALKVKTVCVDINGISGEFRKPNMEVIYGSDTESTRLENGIKYRFDVTKAMFSSGNIGERMRMRNLDCNGETVLDMFAGIGYFSLPIAKYSGARRVFACEKNYDSYMFLVKNIRINGLIDKIIPILSDNRNMPGIEFADRILMGYVQTTSEFLDNALRMIRPGGIIHYHDTFYTGNYINRINDIFERACHGKYNVLDIHEVKSFAPSVSHYVADVRVKLSHRNYRL